MKTTSTASSWKHDHRRLESGRTDSYRPGSSLWTGALAARRRVVAATALFLVTGALADAEELIVQAGETHALRAGNHQYDLIRLGLGATIELTGATLVIAEKLVTDGDASVRYRGSDTEHNPKYFDFVILDGHGMQGTLMIDGSGKSRLEANAGYARELQGDKGEPGAPGETGMDIDLSLFEVNPAAQVRLVSRGGHGGKGGDGGAGRVYFGPETCYVLWGPGRGGETFCDRDRHGGSGGDGANGGNGGDAGRIRIFGVTHESIPAFTLTKLRKFVDENIHTDVVSGKGGDGGAGGSGEGAANGHAGAAGDDGAFCKPVKVLLLPRVWLDKDSLEYLCKPGSGNFR